MSRETYSWRGLAFVLVQQAGCVAVESATIPMVEISETPRNRSQTFRLRPFHFEKPRWRDFRALQSSRVGDCGCAVGHGANQSDVQWALVARCMYSQRAAVQRRSPLSPLPAVVCGAAIPSRRGAEGLHAGHSGTFYGQFRGSRVIFVSLTRLYIPLAYKVEFRESVAIIYKHGNSIHVHIY